jgi:acetyltransferase-like isoleucine patch superfamily enzyme
LGANAVILPGAQIGEHVVVAAGAVVRGEIPDRCVVAGVPGRILKRWVEGAGWVSETNLTRP